jgi:dCTP deaminase
MAHDNSLLTDKELIEVNKNFKMITPFIDHQVRSVGDKRVISYGLSSSGYDVRLGTNFAFFNQQGHNVVDPKNFEKDRVLHWVRETDQIIMPPHSYLLAETMEAFKIPDFITGVCVGKSTYARCGVIVNVTPLEPGWQGILTLEIANVLPNPVILYPTEGICQIQFQRHGSVGTSYNTRQGKYQDQTGLTPART